MAEPLRTVPAQAISAAARDGEIEVLVIPRVGDPLAFTIGPVAGSTLIVLLRDAIEEVDDAVFR